MLGMRSPRDAWGLRVAAIAAAALAPLALWSSSCVLEGFERVPGPPVPPDAEIDGGCPHATYPPPPDVAAAGGDKEFVVAVRSVNFGETDDSPAIGLDLDLQCTCQGDGPTCMPLAGAPEACDGPEGRDNGAARVFDLLASAVGADAFGSEYYSQLAESGEWSVLIRVRGYSGGLNDDRVRLDWYIAPNFDIAVPLALPAWDGTDQWPISSDSFNSVPDGGFPADSGAAALDDTKFTDPNAYVSNGVLVAALPETVITLAGNQNRMSMLVSGAFVVGHIKPVLPGEGDGYALRDAMLVGRWKVSEVFNAISSFRDNNGEPFCTDSLFYDVGKRQFCRAADILVSSGSPTLPCDALSFGILLQAHPAKLGDIFAPPPPTPGCLSTNDPALDTCDNVD